MLPWAELHTGWTFHPSRCPLLNENFGWEWTYPVSWDGSVQRDLGSLWMLALTTFWLIIFVSERSLLIPIKAAFPPLVPAGCFAPSGCSLHFYSCIKFTIHYEGMTLKLPKETVAMGEFPCKTMLIFLFWRFFSITPSCFWAYNQMQVPAGFQTWATNYDPGEVYYTPKELLEFSNLCKQNPEEYNGGLDIQGVKEWLEEYKMDQTGYTAMDSLSRDLHLMLYLGELENFVWFKHRSEDFQMWMNWTCPPPSVWGR